MGKMKSAIAFAAGVLALSLTLSLGAFAATGVPLRNRTPELWERLIGEMSTAQSGDTVFGNIGNCVYVPLEVLAALENTEGVSLQLRLGDANVMTITSDTVPQPTEKQRYWYVKDLKELFPPKSTQRVWKVKL